MLGGYFLTFHRARVSIFRKVKTNRLVWGRGKAASECQKRSANPDRSNSYTKDKIRRHQKPNFFQQDRGGDCVIIVDQTGKCSVQSKI